MASLQELHIIQPRPVQSFMQTHVLHFTAALLWLMCGCRSSSAPEAASTPSSREMLVYTSLDRPYAEPVMREFERETGLRVKDVYDTEATKSLGLA